MLFGRLCIIITMNEAILFFGTHLIVGRYFEAATFAATVLWGVETQLRIGVQMMTAYIQHQHYNQNTQ